MINILIKKATVLLCSLLLPAFSYSSCGFQDANSLLESIKKNHPLLRLNKSRNKTNEKLVAEAGQRPNPIFSAEGTEGESIEGEIQRTRLSLQHTIEWGGKRDSRIAIAQNRIELEKNKLRDESENALIDAVLKLHRLKQVYELIPVYKEARLTLQRILKTKKSRKNLSPEESVERETLELAVNDYQLKISNLETEKDNLQKHLILFSGKNCSLSQDELPQSLKLPSDISSLQATRSYSKLEAAKDSLNLATAKLGLEDSKAYPNIQIGPVYEIEKVNEKNFHSLGVGITMNLPLFQRNNGARERAGKEISQARIQVSSIEKEALLDLNTWKNRYEKLRRSLEKIASRSKLSEKHQRIENLFKRGIISTALIIESHRQLIEFTNTILRFELGAVEALWNIYKINGVVFKQQI